MNDNLDQKKEFAIVGAIKLKEAGKRMSYIIGKFPDYESEIREIFGIVAFIKENDTKIFAPKNVLKTTLSKMTAGSQIQAASLPRKELMMEKGNNIHIPDTTLVTAMEDTGDYGAPPEIQDSLTLGKWKIILPVIILAVAAGILLLRSDSKKTNEIINQNIGTSQNSDELPK